MVALASVVAAGGWRAVSPALASCAAAVSLALASMVLPQVPGSLRARADYGVHWPLRPPPKRSAMSGEAGFNLLPSDGTLRFIVRPRGPEGRTDVTVSIDGAIVDRARLHRREHHFEIATDQPGLIHVELSATNVRSGEPAPLFVVVPRHP